MLEGNECVDEVLPGKSAGGGWLVHWRHELRLARQLRRKRFDLALDLTTSDRSAILTRLSGAPVRLGYESFKGFLGRSRLYTHRIQPERQQHIVRKHLRLLEPLGIKVPAPRLEFMVAGRDRQVVEQHLPGGGRILQVHPLSRIPRKNWPAPFLAEVLNVVAAEGWRIVLTGSNDPEEKEWLRDLTSRLAAPALDLSGKFTLRQLGALSAKADCFLGVDTAPMHIAAAMGTPVIAFFGPSSETLWAPWGTKSLVLSRELSCRLPCKDKGCQTIHCLREFTPSMVLPRISEFLRPLSSSPVAKS